MLKSEEKKLLTMVWFFNYLKNKIRVPGFKCNAGIDTFLKNVLPKICLVLTKKKFVIFLQSTRIATKCKSLALNPLQQRICNQDIVPGYFLANLASGISYLCNLLSSSNIVS